MSTREASLQAVAAGERWDVLVIGGGASGLGAALEAVTRGYRTLLVEQADFAQATSSRSTKLIHGGVRYLAQGNLGLVREALRERALLLRNAPGLVHPLPLIIPLQSLWERAYLGAGLKLYDLLAGARRLSHSRHLSPAALRAALPGFAGPAPRGGILFQDGQFDDARLAIALLRTFLARGGSAVNYAPVRELMREKGRIAGAVFEDRETGTHYETRARAIVNATGVFSDAVQRLERPEAAETVAPSQGIHLVLPPRFLTGDTGVLIPKTADGRVLFALPWQGRVLLGTTDTPVKEASLEPRARPEEIEFLLDHARRFLGWEIGRGEVLSVYAGLRPLVKAQPGRKTSALARDHVITVSAGGVVSIAGGKWTTYRLMGEQTIDRAAHQAGLPLRASITADLLLEVSEPGVDESLAEISRAAVREEMARTVEDVLSRRTRSLILNARAALQQAPEVARAMAAELGRPTAWEAEQVRVFATLAEGYLLPV